MKIRSLKYLIGGGLKNVWLNKLMSLASIGVLIACMAIIGAAILVSLNVDKALGEIEKQNVVMVYFNDLNSVLFGEESDASGNIKMASEISPDEYIIHNDEEALQVCKNIEAIENVESVEYISSEAGLEELKQSVLNENAEYFSFLSDEEYGNPLSAGARVVIKDMSSFGQTIDTIKNVEGVDTIQSNGDLADKITSIKNAVSIAGSWIVGILMIISLVIVSNTIRVTMYNRKLEISIMKAVGATDSFVRLPFMVEGIIIGLVSAVLSLSILYFIYKAVIATMGGALSMTQTIPFTSVMWPLFGLFVCIGVVSGFIGSLLIISKYLKKEGSEFRVL